MYYDWDCKIVNRYEAFFTRGEWGRCIYFGAHTLEEAKKKAKAELKAEIGKIKRGTKLEWVKEANR